MKPIGHVILLCLLLTTISCGGSSVIGGPGNKDGDGTGGTEGTTESSVTALTKFPENFTLESDPEMVELDGYPAYIVTGLTSAWLHWLVPVKGCKPVDILVDVIEIWVTPGPEFNPETAVNVLPDKSEIFKMKVVVDDDGNEVASFKVNYDTLYLGDEVLHVRTVIKKLACFDDAEEVYDFRAYYD